MSYDDWPENTMDSRREAIRKTIRTATLQELRELGEQAFTVVTDPWAERYADFLKQHASMKFHIATIPGGAKIVYCREANRAVWFLPGTGMGIVQPKGLAALAEIVDKL